MARVLKPSRRELQGCELDSRSLKKNKNAMYDIRLTRLSGQRGNVRLPYRLFILPFAGPSPVVSSDPVLPAPQLVLGLLGRRSRL